MFDRCRSTVRGLSVSAVGDLLVRPALGAELEHLALPGRERVERQLAARPAPALRFDERRDLVDERRPGRLAGEEDVVPAVERDEPRAPGIRPDDLDGVVERRRPVADRLEDQRRRA